MEKAREIRNVHGGFRLQQDRDFLLPERIMGKKMGGDLEKN